MKFEIVAARLGLARIFLVEISSARDLGVAIQGVVVEVILAIERQHALVAGQHSGSLRPARRREDKSLVQLLQKRRGVAGRRTGQPSA